MLLLHYKKPKKKKTAPQNNLEKSSGLSLAGLADEHQRNENKDGNVDNNSFEPPGDQKNGSQILIKSEKIEDQSVEKKIIETSEEKAAWPEENISKKSAVANIDQPGKAQNNETKTPEERETPETKKIKLDKATQKNNAEDILEKNKGYSVSTAEFKKIMEYEDKNKIAKQEADDNQKETKNLIKLFFQTPNYLRNIAWR